MSRRRRLGAVLLPLLAAVLSGCEPVMDPAPASELAPEAARRVLADGSLAAGGTVLDEAGNEYTLVEGSLPSLLSSLHVSRLLDGSGGTLALAGHSLHVPAGAVRVPTLFVLVVLPDGKVEVELQALVSGLLGTVDVGAEGFARPVSLSLSFAGAKDVADPAELTILHLREDGLAEPLESRVDPATRTVTASLEHFSRYCMAIP